MQTCGASRPVCEVSAGEERADGGCRMARRTAADERRGPETLAEVARWFGTEVFREDRAIVQQGDPGDRFYMIAPRDGGGFTQRGRTQRATGEIAGRRPFRRNGTAQRPATKCDCAHVDAVRLFVAGPRDLFDRLLAREPEFGSISGIMMARAARGPGEKAVAGGLSLAYCCLGPAANVWRESRRRRNSTIF